MQWEKERTVCSTSVFSFAGRRVITRSYLVPVPLSLSLLPSFLLSARHSWTCQALAYKQLPWSALSALPAIRVIETKVALFVTHEVIIQDAAMHIQVATLFWNETLRFL